MAGSLIETLSGDFDASDYKDGYREALNAVIEAKVEGREVVQPTDSQPTTGTVVDLMAALRASVEAAKSGQPAAAAPPGRAGAERAPAKAVATRKAASRPAPAKRSPAKKAAADDPAAADGKPARKATRKTA